MTVERRSLHIVDTSSAQIEDGLDLGSESNEVNEKKYSILQVDKNNFSPVYGVPIYENIIARIVCLRPDLSPTKEVVRRSSKAYYNETMSDFVTAVAGYLRSQLHSSQIYNKSLVDKTLDEYFDSHTDDFTV